MDLEDFDYALPAELIAQQPLAQRSASRLLHVAPAGGVVDRRFDELPGLLRAGDLLVVNDSRVIAARLFGAKPTGGRIEIVIERPTGEHTALALLRSSKTPRAGTVLRLDAGGTATVEGRRDELFALRFDQPLMPLLERAGSVPLPPYIEREPDRTDAERYQTVYAQEPGSVAAPTAGLHFDEALLQRLRDAGIGIASVTLHVGVGTFAPVRSQRIDEHRMHAERYRIPPSTAAAIARTRAQGARVIAVGTTALRTLEGAARDHGADFARVAATEELSGETDLFVAPGFEFRVVDRLITNFHLPRSTLLMLVSAFAGMEPIRAAYRHAIAQRYRFFSYGDAMYIDRAPPGRPGC